MVSTGVTGDEVGRQERGRCRGAMPSNAEWDSKGNADPWSVSGSETPEQRWPIISESARLAIHRQGFTPLH